MQRIGLGWDLHRLKAGRRLILGGVEIPSDFGEDAHSDGDVLTHALIDALLGAAALGDIGALFPSSDPSYKDADSICLLKTAFAKVRAAGYKIVNIDSVVALQKPAVLPYRSAIIKSLSAALQVDEAAIFVKAKTGEALGDVGQSKAIWAQAICLLETL
ncbi:MAG: 2-C-methyl-D-erythritol 2,4-cyclodiphosphate synthase [Termitinemataceae bacterium]|nr:MAG: 2-C-methyl-D-erythritol 2,4-cyclodiphosphate synthase [Termitinemataceae bacterium]